MSQPNPTGKTSKSWRSIAIAATVALGVGGLGGLAVEKYDMKPATPTLQTAPVNLALSKNFLAIAAYEPIVVTPPPPLPAPAPLTVQQIIAQVEPSVAVIDTHLMAPQTDPFGNPVIIPGPDGKPQILTQMQEAVGTGFIFSTKQGEIDLVTNDHVVGGMEDSGVTVTDIKVRFNNNREYAATLVGVDQLTDIAVLRINATPDAQYPLTPLTWGNSDDVRQGDPVLAMGNPLDEEFSVSRGIISALHRPITAMDTSPLGDALQIDAPINPGNSGGPTFNAQGQVIGINELIKSPTGANIGLGFSIPSNIAKWVAGQILENGQVNRGMLGVEAQDVFNKQGQSAGEALVGSDPKAIDSLGQGALIHSVVTGSAADKAGLKAGDIVTAFDGKPIANAQALSVATGMTSPGDKADISFTRGEQTITKTIVIGAPQDASPPAPAPATHSSALPAKPATPMPPPSAAPAAKPPAPAPATPSSALPAKPATPMPPPSAPPAAKPAAPQPSAP